MTINMIFFGPQGSGKGTYAQRVGPQLGIPQVSTGDIFRAAIKSGSTLGKKVEGFINAGQLVPDEIVLEVVKHRLEQEDCKKGFIFDGFPRTLDQAKTLDNIKKIDAVINLVVPDSVVITRLSARIQCKNCSKIFNKLTLKPKEEGVCDDCGGELYQRDDDTLPVIKERLQTYKKLTVPIIDYYKKKGIVIDIECNSVDIPPEIPVSKIMDGLRKKNFV